jgi:hypothetical protein
VGKYDGGNDGKFDGSPPDPYKASSWRGVLLMLVVIAVVLVIGTYAYVSAVSGPDLRVPIVDPH